MVKYIFVLLLASFVSKLNSQNFILNQALSDSLPNVKTNSIKIIDLNRDGYNDVILSGYDASRYGVYLDVRYGTNDGQLSSGLEYEFITYPDTIGEFIGGLGNISLADVNRDGNVDLYLNGSARSHLMMNFLDDLEISVGGMDPLTLTYSNAQFSDINLDGTPDLFIMGVDETQDLILNRLYLNDGERLELDPTPNFPDLINGKSEWVDYDNDGDMDLLITGNTADYRSSVSRFFKNEPSGRLIEDTNQDIIGLKASSLKFMDLDNDGDQDLIASGWNVIDNNLVTKVYQNEPLGTYVELPVDGLHAVAYGDIDAVDIDHDGDLDISISGVDSVSNFATRVHSLGGKVYKNEGSFNFTEFLEVSGARILRFADLNGDLKPDIISNGTTDLEDPQSSFTDVYLNDTNFSNSPPNAPTSLTSFAVSTRAIFTWGSGSDQIDTDASLRYNVKIGTSSGGYDLLSPSFEYSSANIGQRLIKEFNQIPHGTYYWSVQTIDGTGMTSAWSEEDTLFISRLVTSTQSLPGVYFSSAGWADYNNDGELDLSLTGINFSGTSITKFHLNQDQLLEQDLSQNVQAVFGGQLSWVDYTNDGLLDLSLSGFQIINFQGFPATVFYKNQNGNFVFDSQNEVTYDIYGYTMGINGGQNNHDWGDYDNDGDMDFVIGGVDYYGNRHLSVFTNENGSLSKDVGQSSLSPLFPCMVQWVDVQNDGFLDLVTIGADSLGALGMRVFLNDSTYQLLLSSSWSNMNIGTTAGAFEFGDFNDDGFLDFALIGNNSENSSITNIYTNTGDTFALEETGHQLHGVSSGRPSWGDYDNDGDLDLYVSGLFTDPQSNESRPFTGIYEQNDGQFTLDTTLNMDSLGYSFSEFGDYDSDGDLDLFAAGVNSNADVVSKIYDNLENINNSNKQPNQPYGLEVLSINKDQVHLSWQKANDGFSPFSGQTQQDGLSYQLQVGSNGTTEENSIISGSYGNLSKGSITTNFKYIENIPEGNYMWRVRSLDHGKSVSSWSNPNYFYIDITPPSVDTVRANYLTSKDLIIVVRFKEDFYLNLNNEPKIILTHPDTPDFNGDGINDSLIVVRQSYTGDEWTGSITLPDQYYGKAISLSVSGAIDERGNLMEEQVIYKSPQSIISQSGGTSISLDGNAFVLIPQNALNADISMNIKLSEKIAELNDSTSLLGHLYDINPADLNIEKPAIIRMKLNDDSVSSVGSFPFISRVDEYGMLDPIGGSIVTISGNRYIQTQTFDMGTFGIFTSASPVFNDTSFVDVIECQPRIFTPSGNLFEFNKTNILYNINNGQNAEVKVRIFNLAGRLKRVLSHENPVGGGNQNIVWDGRDGDGSVVPSGLYIVTLEKNKEIFRTTVGVLNR